MTDDERAAKILKGTMAAYENRREIYHDGVKPWEDVPADARDRFLATFEAGLVATGLIPPKAPPVPAPPTEGERLAEEWFTAKGQFLRIDGADWNGYDDEAEASDAQKIYVKKFTPMISAAIDAARADERAKTTFEEGEIGKLLEKVGTLNARIADLEAQAKAEATSRAEERRRASKTLDTVYRAHGTEVRAIRAKLNAQAEQPPAPTADAAEAEELYAKVIADAPELKEEGVENFDGYFVHWDEIIKVANRAWPEGNGHGYGESPTELICQIIDERDDAKKALAAQAERHARELGAAVREMNVRCADAALAWVERSFYYGGSQPALHAAILALAPQAAPTPEPQGPRTADGKAIAVGDVCYYISGIGALITAKVIEIGSPSLVMVQTGSGNRMHLRPRRIYSTFDAANAGFTHEQLGFTPEAAKAGGKHE